MPIFGSGLEFFLRLWKELCVSKQVCVCVCVLVGCCECVFVRLPCPCLRLMSQPLRGWHWTVVPFWTIALARVSDNTTSSVLSLAPSCFLRHMNHFPEALPSPPSVPWCLRKILLFGFWCVPTYFLSQAEVDWADLIVCWGYWAGWEDTGCDQYFAPGCGGTVSTN